MTSAAEAEIQTIFHNARTAVPIRATLSELRHPQPPTPIHCDNTTAASIINKNIKQKWLRAMNV